MNIFKGIVLAGIGGFFGTILRYLSEALGGVISTGPFPVGTFIANIVGCFLIGVFYGWVKKRTFMTKSLNVLLITGLCGGLTTFSSFCDEIVTLIGKGDYYTFIWYLLLSVLLGMIMVLVGSACVRPEKNDATPAQVQS